MMVSFVSGFGDLAAEGLEGDHLTTLSAPISSTSRAQPARITPPRRRTGPGSQRVRPAVQRISTASMRPRPSATCAATTWPPTNSAARCTRRCSRAASSRPTAHASPLDPAAQTFFVDWEKAAKDLVAALRSMAGRNPYDRALSDLVGELSTRGDAVRAWWAAHNLRYHQTGTKRLQHPVVGDLELSYEVMELSADTGLRLAIFTAEAGSRSEEALNVLASWATTPDQLPDEHPAADDARARNPGPKPIARPQTAAADPRP